MNIYKTSSQISYEIEQLKQKGKTIGFVPTMGCLHEGHLSLVKSSKKGNDITIVSVFVNPNQFNNPEDLRNYPRTPEEDIKKLQSVNCDFLFMPSEKDIYPVKDERIFDFGELDKVMEGKYRKNHFNGVVQVVSNLFNIVKPDRAYFGQKDFQQLTIIKYLVKQLNLSVEIIPCPIIREKNGLAMSSRNELLTSRQREEASIINKVLKLAYSRVNEMTVKEIKDWVIESINANKEAKVEYFEIVDNENLKSINDWSDTKNIIGCIAVYFDKIRLIDNIKFNI